MVRKEKTMTKATYETGKSPVDTFHKFKPKKFNGDKNGKLTDDDRDYILIELAKMHGIVD